MSLAVTVTYTPPTKTAGATITFDPIGPWPVANGATKTFHFNRAAGSSFKFRSLTFWADVNQSVAQTFRNSDDRGAITQFPDGQITQIDTSSTSTFSFQVTNNSTSSEPLYISLEVTVEDMHSGLTYSSRDPQIELEGPGT